TRRRAIGLAMSIPAAHVVAVIVIIVVWRQATQLRLDLDELEHVSSRVIDVQSRLTAAALMAGPVAGWMRWVARDRTRVRRGVVSSPRVFAGIAAAAWGIAVPAGLAIVGYAQRLALGADLDVFVTLSGGGGRPSTVALLSSGAPLAALAANWLWEPE